jgi:hypothetical protein
MTAEQGAGASAATEGSRMALDLARWQFAFVVTGIVQGTMRERSGLVARRLSPRVGEEPDMAESHDVVLAWLG